MGLNWEFCFWAILLLTPITTIQFLFMHESQVLTTHPISSPDFTKIFYDGQSYSPTIPLIFGTANRVLGNFGIMITALLITTFIPAILLFYISKNLAVPAVYLYGSLIGSYFLVSGTFPAALIVVLMLSCVAWPRLWPLWMVLAFWTHQFGPLAILFVIGYNHFTPKRVVLCNS